MVSKNIMDAYLGCSTTTRHNMVVSQDAGSGTVPTFCLYVRMYIHLCLSVGPASTIFGQKRAQRATEPMSILPACVRVKVGVLDCIVRDTIGNLRVLFVCLCLSFAA